MRREIAFWFIQPIVNGLCDRLLEGEELSEIFKEAFEKLGSLNDLGHLRDEEKNQLIAWVKDQAVSELKNSFEEFRKELFSPTKEE